MAKVKIETAITEGDEIRYIGEGSYVAGIPARNLSGAEWNELPAATQHALLVQNLYALPDGAALPVVEEMVAPAQAAPTE